MATGIAFYSNKEGQSYVLDSNKPKAKASVMPLPRHSQGFCAWSWSRDGKRLAGESGESQGGIEIYSCESGTYQRLTDFGFNPVWLSDGRRLLF